MTSETVPIARFRESFGRGFNWQQFLQDNVTGSWYLTAWIVFLTLITLSLAVKQYDKLTFSTVITLTVWLFSVLLVVNGELLKKHTIFGRWLKTNVLGSVSNALLTLFLALALIAALNGIWQWGFVNANFNPAETTPEFQQVTEGATWGVIWGARKLLMTGRLDPEHTPRVWLALVFILMLWAVTYVAGRPMLRDRLRPIRRTTMFLWLLSPIILYIILAGVAAEGAFLTPALLGGTALVLGVFVLLWLQKVIKFSWLTLTLWAVAWPLALGVWQAIGRSGVFPPINVDNWGGLMLSLIVAASVIVLSLPIGMILALGRRSQVYGIPAWIIWPTAIGATLWGFTTTPQLLADSRSAIEQIFAFWPFLILAGAYFFKNYFKGNVVAGACTTFIEFIRSVPLITLLFMGIIMAPFFFETGVSIAKPWPVIVGYTLFTSAYTAEDIRGGLQAIPVGQYEAADSLGFNTFQKMRFIILPQALRIVIPALVGGFIGAFKSSSLVSIVGLFDLLGITRAVLANNLWLGLRVELYVFLAFVYFIGSFVMSSYSRRLEARLGVGLR